MPTIADLRAANPWADDVSDLELLNYRAQQTGTTLEDAAKAFGVKYTPDRNAFMAGLSSGVDQLQGLGYGMIGAGARALGGDSVADWADKNVRINNSEAQFNGRPDLENIEDQSLGSMPGYLVYQGAKQLPIIGGTLAASAVMPEAVIPAALSRGLAYAPRAIGGGGLSSSALQAAEGYAAKKALTQEAIAAGNQFARIGATSYPMSVGSLYNEAVERGDPTQADALAAFAAGVPYAAGEAVMPAIVNRGLRPGGLGFTGNLATRMGKAAGVDAAGEAGTELFQNELEMGFAGPLTDEEKFSRRLNSAVAGGLVGGMYGAPAGIRKPVTPGVETDLLALPTPNQVAINADNRAYPGVETVVDEANNVAAAQRANSELWAARNAHEQSMDRSGATDLLGDPLSYPIAQTGSVVPTQENVFGESAAVQPEATVVTPNRRQMSLDLSGQTRPDILYGNQYNPASLPGSTGQQAGSFAQLPVTDQIRTEPTARDQAVATVNGVRTVKALKAEADTALAKKLITPEQHVEFMNEVDTNRKMKLVEKRALLISQIEKNNGTQAQKAVPTEAGQQAAVPVPGAVSATEPQQVAQEAVQAQTAQAPQKPANVDDLPRYKQEMGKFLTANLNDGELQAFVGLNGLRGEDGNAEGYSTRALARDAGVSHVTVFNRATAAKAKIEAAAAAAGIDTDTALEILGLGSDVLDVGVPQTAYENGVRTVRAESDDFEDSFGYSRNEGLDINEKGAVEDAYDSDTSDQNAVGSAEFEQVADNDTEREDYARKLVDYAGNPISDVDFEDAAGEYNSHLEDGDVPFNELGQDKQIQIAKAYVAMMDKKLSNQAWMNVVSEVADEAVDTRRNRETASGKTETVRGTTGEDSEGSAGRARQSIAESANPTTVERIKSVLKPLFFTNSRFDNRVTVVKTVKDLPLEALRFSQISGGDAQAFVLPNGRAYMIADNIDAGSELAVFLHEVGVHLGMEKLLGGKDNFLKLAQQIAAWYDRNDGSAESQLAHRAIRRTTYAASTTENFSDNDYVHEIIAYFVEEAVNAGYTPTAAKSVKNGINAWLKTLWDYAKAALRKFGIDRLDTLTTQDVVDLATAAAHLNMTGRNTESEVGRAVRFSSRAAALNPAEGFFAKAGEFLDNVLTNPIGALSKVQLGWMTLEQIADRVKSDAVKKYTSVMTEMQRFSKHMIYQAAVIDQDWSKLSTNVRANLSSIMRDATRMGFDPEVDTASSDEQRVLKDRFDKTLTKEAKDVYRRVRDHYKNTFEERKQILMDAAANGTLSDRNKAEVEKMFTEVKGPYFPLMRLGKWYAVGMSKELSALQAKVDAGDITAEEQDRYRILRKDKAHYITKSFDTRSEAKRFSKELGKKYNESYFNISKSVIDNAIKSTPDLAKMQDYLTAGMPEGARDDLRNMLAQMYFDMLPDSSPLKRMMKREGVYGEEEDMRKVFAASSISMAHHVSRLKYANKLSEHLVSLDKETKRNEEMRHVYNELVERANLSTKVDDTPFADTVNQISYFSHLGLSPAFILTNMTQVPMITAPWLTARYGFGKTKSALTAAYVDAFRIIKGTMQKNGWEAEYDWKGVFKEGSNEDRLLSKLLDMNLIDITMEHDLGAVARIGGTGNRDKLNKAVKIASLPVRITEAANRIVTALSSYRLAMDKGMSHDEAVEHAAKAISETQLNYSALNAPRYMQTVFGSKALAKMVFQFRKYQQGMVYLITSNAKDAFKGDKEAMKTLFGVMATTGLMAGATGLPFAGSLFWLATAIGSMFDDDDEPFDARESFRNYLADMLGDQFALAVTKGLPTLMGFDISGNVGMGNIGMPLPYVRDGKKPSDSMKEMLASAAGAPFGTMMEMADGFGELMDGDMVKGATHVIPLKLAKNIIKAADFKANGMVDSKGNVILPSERFDGWDVAFRAAGFSTTKETEYYEANSAMQKAKQAASDTRTALLREYAEARIKGETIPDFQDRIADFNTRHPEKGVRIDQSSLLKAVQTRKQLSQGRTETGLRQDKTMKPYLHRAAFADGQ